MYADKRKRKDNKDEFRAADATHKVFSDRIKDLAKGRKRPIRMMALAKLKLRPRARRNNYKQYQTIQRDSLHLNQ